MAKNTVSTKCLIGEARVNYPSVFAPESFGDGEAVYAVTLSFPKSDTALMDKIEKAIDETTEKFKAMNGGKLPKSFKLPLIKDGDEDYETEAFAGLWTIKAKSKFKPEIVKKAVVMGKTQLVPITDEEEFYAGCYCYASVDFVTYDRDTSKGISCRLNNILKSRDGERFSGGSKESVEDTYAGVLGDIDFADDEEVF